MNKVILMGRLTRDPDIRYSQGHDQMAIARFTLAVDRRFRRDNNDSADFISCVAFGKTAEFFSRYARQGSKMCVEGRIQTGSYVRQDGTKVYTTDVVVENAEFAESKAAADGRAQNAGYNQYNTQQAPVRQQPAQNAWNGSGYQGAPAQTAEPQYEQPPFMEPPVQSIQPVSDPAASDEGFMDIQDSLEDEGLPFE